jgi:hypothetical protein
MGSRVTVTRIESIPSSLDVRHIDELSEGARDCFYQIVTDGMPVAVESDVETELSQCDVVKFTDYYRVTLADSQASGHVTA